MARGGPPIGVVLAGGLGARIGGSKAIVELKGRPLVSYPCEALRQALGEVAIMAKADTELPSIPGVSVWVEPEAARHPLIGILHALDMAGGRAVVICPVDLPFVTPSVVHRLAHAEPHGAPVVIAVSGRLTQPLLGCYRPGALELIQRAGLAPDASVHEAVEAIRAERLEVEPSVLFNVNAPDDLLQAAAMLDHRPAPAR